MNEDEKKYVIKFQGKGIVDLGNKNNQVSLKDEYKIIEEKGKNIEIITRK